MKFTALLKERNVPIGQLAERLGLHRVALYAWNRNGVPVKHCVPIEGITEGKIHRKELRPDDWQKFWPEM